METSLIQIVVLVAIVLVYGWAAMRMFKSKFTRTGVIAFFLIGTFLAVVRVSWVWYLGYRMRTHTWSVSLQTFNSLVKYFFPEEIVVSLLPIEDPFRSTLFLSLVLIIGSFFWASILLLVGARPRKELDRGRCALTTARSRKLNTTELGGRTLNYTVHESGVRSISIH